MLSDCCDSSIKNALHGFFLVGSDLSDWAKSWM
jgi:hypothetical protein